MNAEPNAAAKLEEQSEASRGSPRPSGFYFDCFEDRSPPPAQTVNRAREFVYRLLALTALVLGARYLYWRWSESLNLDALWFSLPLALAESLAYVGAILLFSTTWTLQDSPREKPPSLLSECVDEFSMPPTDRAVSVDIFITTYDEDVELVRKSAQAANRVRAPGETQCRVYVLDDGARRDMRSMATSEHVGYISRRASVGYKAGNLRHALLQTNGDFIVICDADTRLFPEYLEETLGYFRDPLVSWVQTPQWFFDVPEGSLLSDAVEQRWGPRAGHVARWLESWIGPVRWGRDPLSPLYS